MKEHSEKSISLLVLGNTRWLIRELTNRPGGGWQDGAVVAVVHHQKLSLMADIIIRILNIYWNLLAMTSCLGSRLDFTHANKMLLSSTDKHAIPTPLSTAEFF